MWHRETYLGYTIEVYEDGDGYPSTWRYGAVVMRGQKQVARIPPQDRYWLAVELAKAAIRKLEAAQ